MDARIGATADSSSYPEVSHEGVATREQGVFWLDIPVNNPVLVRVVERVGDLARDPESIVDRELLLAVQSSAERLTLDVRHREPELAAWCRSGVVDRDDMRVLQAGGEFDLSCEPLRSQRRSEIGPEYLEGDKTVVSQVADEIDGGHATLPEFALDRVAVRERYAQLLLQVRCSQ